MKKIVCLIWIASVFSYSNAEYVSKKQYTFQEVTEVLSEKIIKNREKIEELERNNNVGELKKDVEELKLAVEQLSKKNDGTKLKIPSVINKKEESNLITIDKQLFEKVR